MARESKFQAELNRELRVMFPGCIILKNDPNYLQGFPDWIILYENKWACYEAKRNRHSEHQPNQDYYVDLLYSMSYCSFVYPENREVFLNEIQHALQPRRSTRIFRGQ